MNLKHVIAFGVLSFSLILSFYPAYGLEAQGSTDVMELARTKFSSVVWRTMSRELGNDLHENGMQEELQALFGNDVIVSNNDLPAANQDEASIAANPLNSMNLVGGSHDDYLRFIDAAYFYSFDGGLTWTHVHRLPGTDTKPNAGDPVVAFDSNGNAYYAYLWGNFVTLDISVAVSKSTDGGVTWGLPRIVLADPPSLRAWDKEWLEVDNWPTSPSKNTIYLTATYFDLLMAGHVRITRSADGGLTWSTPFEVSDASLGTTDQLSAIAPAPDGRVFVAWLDLGRDGFGGTDTVKVRRGDSGGTLWQPIKKIQTIKGLSKIGMSRAASNPTIIVAPKPPGNNPLNYNVYVAYSAIGSDNEPQIRVATSTDLGNTWAIKVLDSNAFHEFFPALASQPDGTIHLIGGAWSPTTTTYLIWRAFSTNGGTTWTGSQISDQAYSLPTGSRTYVIGDYFDVDYSTEGRIHPIWTARFADDNDIITDRGP